MEDFKVCQPVKRMIPKREEPKKQTPATQKQSYCTEGFTDGEYYTIHLQNSPSSFTEAFHNLIDDITDRFTSGEWQGDHEAQIDQLLADVAEADQPQLIRAMAIDAFLANCTEEELANFNYHSQHRQAQKNKEYMEQLDLSKRGFSNGSHNSFGIFTEDYTKKERG